MGSAKENEDESAHPSGTDMAIDAEQPLQQTEHASSPHPVPMDQDDPVPSENRNPSSQTIAAPNDHNNVLPQSHSETSSINNTLESKSTMQQSQTEADLGDPQKLETEAAPDTNSAQLKTPSQDEIVPNDNIEGLRADTQPQIESALNGINMELDTVHQQTQNKAVSSYDNVEFKTSPQTEAAADDKDMDLKSSPQKHPTEAGLNDNNVDLKSGPQQPLEGSSSPAPSDDSKTSLKSETEPPTKEKTTGNENSDCKPETCGVDGTTNSTSNMETAKLTADSKSEPSEVPQSKSGHADTVTKEHSEPAIPHAETSSIKTEHENKQELKNGNSEMDVAPKSNGNSTSKSSFLLENYHDGSESGSEEEQLAFMKELENFFRERSTEFKPPKFYGEGLNCLKLWRAVMRLGGYDKVTTCKLWRQVGESFKPPKTCTTVSWTFRGFYEKALLDYERHKTNGGELNLPLTSNPEPVIVDNQTPGSGRARRDAAARAMQGWHSQRLLGNGEVSDAIIKDKNSVPMQKREKQLKNLGIVKRKKPSYMEHAVKAARAKTSKPQLDVEVVDLGSPADWVKINVQKTKDCFEVYALVPGLLREEVRVQSDPAGRLVISGEPEHPDNPWGVTPFKKVVSLPSRIDPHQTSAVVTLHGQLFVRVPFEQSD
ncbi:AT-rich interactive domain-containing protein 6 [Ricinus communis]|uniref:AT-rich interactive domain-containing protein 6 n=1 Tax=Ricinus communis TaxID=3988 RepID=UPI00201B0F03|nr:AT-rich interactive domain-containing protein 6 [Ricinus communis]